MGDWRSHFSYNRQERRGLFYLLLCIVLLQLIYFLVISGTFGERHTSFEADGELDAYIQAFKSPADSVHPYPFNPNFLNDFKGYALGMSAMELDALYAFRARGQWVDSPGEFQEVTGVSDSLLAKIAPYFRFPKKTVRKPEPARASGGKGAGAVVLPPQPRALKDLNQATAGQLRTVRGVGPVLSERIVRFRRALGGFLAGEQLLDVYGLDAEVAARVLEEFEVMTPPEVKKVSLNTATVDELAGILYISYPLAEAIVQYRERSGKIDSLDEIAELDGFPSGKIDRIKLYLGL